METAVRLLLLSLLLLSQIPAANAGWLDDLAEKTKKTTRNWLGLGDEKRPRITDEDLAEYPAHYRFHRVVEPIHQSPLFFVEAGDKSKPTVILVHGLGVAASKDWLQVIPALEKDYHVYALDLPGFGLSNGVYFQYSPEQYSRILNWFVDQYSPDNSPTIVGHSMGGAVSLYFAAAYPKQLQKLVLVDAAGIIRRTSFVKHLADLGIDTSDMAMKMRRFTARAENLSDQVVELTGSMYDPTKLIKDDNMLRKLALAKATNANAALALMETDFSQPDYAKVVPTQMIWGAEDPVAPARTGKALLNVLPKAELHLIADAGHVPMKSHSKQFNALLLKTLATAPRPIEKPALSKSDRTGHCQRDDQSHFRGYYQSLTLDNCKLVVLDNVVADSFSVNNSIVEITNSVLGTVDKPLKIKESALKATASTFNGTITSDDNRFDFAAVEHNANGPAVEVVSQSLFILSLTTINSGIYQGKAHGFHELQNGSLDKKLAPKE